MSPPWLVVSYVGAIIIARILTGTGRPRRSLGDYLRMMLDPTFHLLAWTSLSAAAAPLMEYLLLKPKQLLALNLAGAALVVCSGIVAHEANLTLGAAFTPYVDRSAVSEKRLVTRGIYRYIRHPLYSAGFMLTAGMALMLCSRWAWSLTVLCWAAIVIRTLKEERLLRRNMDGYADYMRWTKRYIPGII